MSEQDPKPCPFCGSGWLELIPYGGKMAQVQCANCGSRGPSAIRGQSEIYERWNKRANPPDAIESLDE